MAMLGRRFINIVAAGKYSPGMLSLHRLDVSKHLFYPSASEALRFVGGEVPSPRQRIPDMQEELPPCAVFSDATATAAHRWSTAFFSLVSPRSGGSEGGRILVTNGCEAGDSIMYHAADEGGPIRAMPGPGLEDFAGPVAVSVVAQHAGGGGGRAAAKEESMYVIHGVRDGEAPRFHVLRFGTPPTPTDRCVGERWYWQSLPPPPFVASAADDGPHPVISAYTVVDGGRTICVSSYAAEASTWCFDTVRGEWWHAGDWEMTFAGRAEYLADLDLWLGLCSDSDFGLGSTYGELCTTAGLSLSAMAKTKKQAPALLQRLYEPPESWMMAPNAEQVELINLGSGRFAIAKVFDFVNGFTSDWEYGPEDHYDILLLTGVEIRPRQPCDIWSCSDGLELIHHKTISYRCDSHKIHQVL